MKKETNEHLTLGLVQFDIVWENSKANLDHLSAMLENEKRHFDILILPETFNSGFTNNVVNVAETPEGFTVNWMKEISARHQCAVCGSLFIDDKGQIFNRFMWVTPDGKSQHYNKRHLFGGETVNRSICKGNSTIIIDYKGWKIFPQICYDLRFPVWSRNVNGYDLMINVANWPAMRKRVWKTLLKARAIENQCYVAGVNRIGKDGLGTEYAGESKIIDAKGIELYSANHLESIEQVSVDYYILQKFRNKFNTLKDGDRFALLH
ncbi:MAG: hypothetical protein JW798_16380 [Prolixibacteraceae bacterium]|nr:hypothetical protein [Prolixibacteraceae bacterium]